MRRGIWKKMSGRAHGTHRPGPLKQQNKTHKHGRHRSKGQLNESTKGRVGMKVLTRQIHHQQRRADKRNKLKQLRSNKRHEVLEVKRSRGGEGVPPHLIVIIPLDPSLNVVDIFRVLTSACGCEESLPFSHTFTLVFPVTRRRFTLLFPPSTDLYAMLDVAKVADCLLFLYSASMSELAPFSQLVLDCCFSQGLPSTAHAVTGFNQHSGKGLSKTKKSLQSLVNQRFPMEALHLLDTHQDAVKLLRYLGNQKRQPVCCRDNHPHLIVERLEYDKCVERLKVTGYLRSRPLSVNGLLHIPGLGDFQMAQIDAAVDMCPLKPLHRRADANSMEAESGISEEGMDEEIKVLEVADPTKQEAVEGEVVPDPMEGEQTWPTEDELKTANDELKVKHTIHRKKVQLPAGTSDYQAAWIVRESDGSSDEEEFDSSEEDGDIESADSVESSSDEECEVSGCGSDIETDMMTSQEGDKYDDNFDLESEKKQLALLRAERNEQLFPDEVDTPTDTLAKIRFQKYRGLKSFKHSSWDPAEDLPRDYARIYQFDNFHRMKRRVLGYGGRSDREGETDQGVLPGWCVTLHVDKVPPSVAELCQKQAAPMVMYGLLAHENKMSVVHFTVRRTSNYTEPVKSKEKLIFHCGVRRYIAGPIFSQHTTGNKHKFEKFFHQGCTTVASVYAPVSYPPQPVLLFEALDDGSHALVANGSLLSVAPSRIICKRIVLSGHPFKIHKKSAVIRYMFFNREDIAWFKPVELRTKYGRRGHIKEPLGTHGHMKCVFDGQLKAQDTVLMNLYKRVYPKWTYSSSVPLPLKWINSDVPTDHIATEHMQH